MCFSCFLSNSEDLWAITDEIRPGELGAGFLYKQGKGSGNWSKRYCVLTENKLYYYLERDRKVLKGEILLANCTSNYVSTKNDKKKKFYFNIESAYSETRIFYTKTKGRREQWMNLINKISRNLEQFSIQGKIFKVGGLKKDVLQERFVICNSYWLDYYEKPGDSIKKGSLYIENAVINPIKNDKDTKHFYFEVILMNTPPALVCGQQQSYNKKGKKKFVFAVNNEYDLRNWIDKLTKLSQGHHKNFSVHYLDSNPAANNESTCRDSENPIHTQDIDNSMKSYTEEVIKPELRCGYLYKKSPAKLKGFQKRYFKTTNTGDIIYYKNESDSMDTRTENKGTILLRDFKPENPVEVLENNEFALNLYTKRIILKADNEIDMMDWCYNIDAWLASYKENMKQN